MKSFPMFFRTTGRDVVICGGGEQAAQKARLILKSDARIIFAAPELDDELVGLVEEGRAAHHAGSITPALFDNAAMAFVATGCAGADGAIHGVVKSTRCPVNVVDRPDLCDLTTPSIVDRDPIVVAIGSEGTAPVLAREIKTKLEADLPVNLGGLAALAGRLRPSAAHRVHGSQRRALWAWVFKGQPRRDWTRGREREAAKAIKAAIAAGRPPQGAAQGHISLVGAGPGARDLMTLRAVERLQEADVIFYDRLVDVDVLELARRDAERVFVGKQVGAHAWPQDRINAVILAEARQGKRVVRLKSGDPGIFGRMGEEITAITEAGISFDVVPGVTAAAASGAAMGASLTERGVTDTLVLTTGQSAEGAPLPDAVRFAAEGTTLALYMAAGQAGRIAQALIAKGLPRDHLVEVAIDVSKASERILRVSLSELETSLSDCAGGAMILVKWPKGLRISQDVQAALV